MTEATELYHRELLRLERLSAELKFDPLFIVVPDHHQINERLLELRAEYYGLDPDALDVSAPNTALSKMFAGWNFDYIDTKECLRAAGRTKDIFYVQDNHLNSLGHRALADCFRQQEILSRIGRRISRSEPAQVWAPASSPARSDPARVRKDRLVGFGILPPSWNIDSVRVCGNGLRC